MCDGQENKKERFNRDLKNRMENIKRKRRKTHKVIKYPFEIYVISHKLITISLVSFDVNQIE